MAQNLDHAATIDALWRRVYDLLRGPGRLIRLPSIINITLASSASLPEKFDDDLLNKIAQLKQAPQASRVALVAEIRGNIHVLATTGAVGHEDAEKLQVMLDQIEQ